MGGRAGVGDDAQGVAVVAPGVRVEPVVDPVEALERRPAEVRAGGGEVGGREQGVTRGAEGFGGVIARSYPVCVRARERAIVGGISAIVLAAITTDVDSTRTDARRCDDLAAAR